MGRRDQSSDTEQPAVGDGGIAGDTIDTDVGAGVDRMGEYDHEAANEIQRSLATLENSSTEIAERIEEVVHARTVNKESDRVAFSCLRETGAQLATGGNANLIGAVHSHPHYNQSYLSELDVAVFGRVSPAIEVMGVYTEPGGVAFFSEESLTRPLDLEVVGGDDETADGAAASGGESG